MTRAQHQAQELAAPLRDLGAEVILLPVIGIAPPLDPEPLRRAVQSCDSYHWILFTSVNAVDAFASYLTNIPKVRIATVGTATREAGERLGLKVSLTPEKFIAESLVETLSEEDLSGKRILIPSAALTRDVIAPALRSRGAHVDVVEAYRNIIPSDAEQRAANVFTDPLPDWVTFASSSAVRNLFRLVGSKTLARVKLASIGPATSATIREHGLEPAAEPLEHSIKGLVRIFSAPDPPHSPE